MEKNSLSKSWIVTCMFVVGMLGLCGQSAYALDSKKIEPDTIEVTFSGDLARDQLEVEIDNKDEAIDYTVAENPPWSIVGVTQLSPGSTRRLLQLKRNPPSSGNETVTIRYKNKTDKKNNTLSGTIRYRSGDTGFWTTESSATFRTVAYTDIPTLSQWGLIIMAGLLLTVGAVVIRRRFKTVPA